jgi:hypothetical protein
MDLGGVPRSAAGRPRQAARGILRARGRFLPAWPGPCRCRWQARPAGALAGGWKIMITAAMGAKATRKTTITGNLKLERCNVSLR